MFEPVSRSGNGTRIERRLGTSKWGRARPTPTLAMRHQARTDWIAFDVAQHSEQVIVFLDWKGPESALPNMAAAVIVLMVTTHMGREQLHHAITQFSILARPKRQVEMVGHQAISK